MAIGFEENGRICFAHKPDSLRKKLIIAKT